MSNIPNRTPNVISAAGAVTPGMFNHITGANSLALTLAAPIADGQEANFVDETGHAHTIVIPIVGSPPQSGLNSGLKSTITFNGTAGSFVRLVSRGLNWWALDQNGVALT